MINPDAETFIETDAESNETLHTSGISYDESRQTEVKVVE